MPQRLGILFHTVNAFLKQWTIFKGKNEDMRNVIHAYKSIKGKKGKERRKRKNTDETEFRNGNNHFEELTRCNPQLEL